MKHLRVLEKENIIVDNLLTECKVCFSNCSFKGNLIGCTVYKEDRRQGIIKTSTSTTFLCCDDTKVTKLFRDKLEALSYAYKDLKIPFEFYSSEAKKTEQQKVNRLVHNLTSLNAHNIQEIYDLVPQELLSSDIQSQIDFIQKEIKKDIRRAALMFLRIAKHNIHMKTEFSIYRKLDRNDRELEIRSHPIQKVLMNVLHTFFVDFANKGIFVEVQNYYGKVNIDYETIQVAIYHLIDNASKYTKPDTNILVQFDEQINQLDLIFTMTSLFIEEDEVSKLIQEGYSGKEAKKSRQQGDGIGMWRIEQMMQLNNGMVKFINGKKKLISDSLTYGENQIILSFPRQ